MGVQIDVKGLSKSFGSSKIWEDVTMSIPAGEVSVLLGPSGTGKSVFLKSLIGLLRPERGEIIVDGTDIIECSAKELYEIRTLFGVMFQDGALFGSMNIYDNTCFPLRKHTDKSEDEIREIVTRRLAEVGLDKAHNKLPNEISGGMRKRAGFARALVMDPKIVFFDEPDSGLDPVRTSLLNDLILDMHAEHKGTYLLVTHDIRTARKVSDYVGLIWKGKVVHYSEAEEAFAHEDPFVRQFLAGESAGPLGMD
jgi:phospholipid/cholesterol/gamma-HCH transport system ATP-binding protein